MITKGYNDVCARARREGPRLVHHEDLGAAQQRARHAQQLPLPEAVVAAVVHHLRQQSLLARCDRVLQPRLF